MSSIFSVFLTTFTKKLRYTYLLSIILIHSFILRFFLIKSTDNKETISMIGKLDFFSVVITALCAIVLIETEMYFINKFLKLKGRANNEKTR